MSRKVSLDGARPRPVSYRFRSRYTRPTGLEHDYTSLRLLPLMPDITRSVFATTSVVGFHRWPDAPDEVKYLSSMHRHLFGILVELPVTALDRQIEFHILKRHVSRWLGDLPKAHSGEINFDTQSCEMIAEDLLMCLRHEYLGLPWYRVTVDEDGENGAIVEQQANG